MCDDIHANRRSARVASYSAARVILESDYAFMNEHAIRSEALYAASLLTELAIGEGDFLSADAWNAETGKQLRGTSAHKLSPNSGYYSSAALLAMMNGRYREAEAMIATPQAEDARMRTARYEAICCALSLKLYLMKGESEGHEALISRLRELYGRGRALGGQDTIVEVLWCVDVLAGKEEEASMLLAEYLRYRREPFPLEWSLRYMTSAEDTWGGSQRPEPVDINRRLAGLALARSAGGNNQFQKSLASS